LKLEYHFGTIKYDKSGTQKILFEYHSYDSNMIAKQKWGIHCNFAREKGFSLKAGSEEVSANSAD
jgi:hypothetical protein